MKSKVGIAVLFFLFIALILFTNTQGSKDSDLSIDEEDIHFSKLNPKTGEDIVIYAIIHNRGGGTNAVVRFYEGDEKNLLGEDMIVVYEGSSAVATVYWKPSYGSHKIFVCVEGTTNSDADPNNNEANVTVGFYQGESALELRAGVATIEEGIERVIPVEVEAFSDLNNVSINIIYQGELNVTLKSPLQNIGAGETLNFYLRIRVPSLKEEEIYDNRTILLQAFNDDFASNVAELKISIHPSVENSQWWSPTVAAAAAAGTIGVFAVIGSTEIGKYKFLSLVIPLYTKLNKEDILDHYIRGKIHGYILAKPGDHYNSIKKALKISNGTFAYHLHVLEREGVIKSRRDGIYKRFYPSEMQIPPSSSQLKEIQRLIVKKIKETPGISQKDIAADLGVASSTVHYHVQDLIKADKIESRKKGRKVRYFLNSGGR